MSLFSAKHVSAGYGKDHIVKDVSFELDNGCMMGILGANGSGKTTLLKAMCGILPHEGNCYVDGTKLEALSPRKIARLCSYIPQKSGISIDISAMDVVLMGFNARLGLLEYPNDEMKRVSVKALEQVGLAGREHINYQHLSEGQKQLCILARTIVSGSRLLLLDEPESALDFRYRYRMLDMIRGWINTSRGGAVISLHDPVLAINYCDRLMILSNGKIMDIISPREDSLQQMEQLLSRIYGPVSLQMCKNRSGKTVLTMLKEDNQ